MALFSSKKKTAVKVAKASPDGSASGGKTISAHNDIARVLNAPRITEKASAQQERGVYVFNVSERATKRDVIGAVKHIYGVTPRAVRMIAIPTKTVRHARTGKYGVKQGGKKAYVQLKQGETITLA